MPRSRPHPDEARSEDAHSEPARLSAQDEVAADLRRQVAILAEQVRRLGEPSPSPAAKAAARPASAAGASDLPPPPRPRPAAKARPVQSAPPADPPAPAPTSAPASTGAPTAGETFAQTSSRLIASVVTLAELAAVEIRASAEVEAAAIRTRAAERLSASTSAQLLALLERQRNMLAALSSQTDRLEQSAAVLRAQVAALEAEREHIAEVLARTAPKL